MKFNYNGLMKRIYKLKPALLAALCILFAFLSCSRSEPQILYGFIELTYYQVADSSAEESAEETRETRRVTTAEPIERYSFFILPEDDDGVENLSELKLYHDREGLLWIFSPEDWILHEENERIWIGSRSIAMVNNAPLPRGQYRAVLINQGGESSERSFTFDVPADSIHPFPAFTISEGMFSLESQFPVNRLICYDLQGNVIQTIPLTEHEGNVRDIRFVGPVYTAALWAVDPEFRISALTEAVVVR